MCFYSSFEIEYRGIFLCFSAAKSNLLCFSTWVQSTLRHNFDILKQPKLDRHFYDPRRFYNRYKSTKETEKWHTKSGKLLKVELSDKILNLSPFNQLGSIRQYLDVKAPLHILRTKAISGIFLDPFWGLKLQIGSGNQFKFRQIYFRIF